ncbi:hypothetical protein pb186bvf_008341 [Paramecium bursaria]
MVVHLHRDQVYVRVLIDKPGSIDVVVRQPGIQAQFMWVKLVGVKKSNQLDKLSNYFSMKKSFYTKKRKVCDLGWQLFFVEKISPLPEAVTKKKFKLLIPARKYPSFQINYFKDVQVRMFYFIAVYFTNQNKTIYKPDKRHKIVVHVICPMPIDQMPCYVKTQSAPIKKCCFTSGESKMRVKILGDTYMIDDEINADISVDNTDSILAINYFKLTVQARLDIYYKNAKQNITSYFFLCQQIVEQKVLAKQKLDFKATLKLSHDQKSKYAIYPQSSIEAKHITYKYTFGVQAVFQFPFHPSAQRHYTAIIPIVIIQQNKREIKQKQKSQSNFEFNSDDVFIYGDQDYEGYGPQVGYFGKQKRNGDFDQSMDSVELRGKVIYNQQMTEEEKVDDYHVIDLNMVNLQTKKTMHFIEQEEKKAFHKLHIMADDGD